MGALRRHAPGCRARSHRHRQAHARADRRGTRGRVRVAWFSHFTIEGNRPATFGHPFWSFRGDLKMLAMMWRGRDAELDRIAQEAKQVTLHAIDAA